MALDLPGGSVSDPATEQNLRFLAQHLPARKVRTGKSTATWTGGATSSGVETVKHGLGGVPAFVDLIVLTEAGDALITPRLIARDDTTFDFQFNSDKALADTLPVLWMAA